MAGVYENNAKILFQNLPIEMIEELIPYLQDQEIVTLATALPVNSRLYNLFRSKDFLESLLPQAIENNYINTVEYILSQIKNPKVGTELLDHALVTAISVGRDKLVFKLRGLGADLHVILVQNLNPKIRVNDLQDIFEKYGQLDLIFIIDNPLHELRPGYDKYPHAYLIADDPRDADDMVRYLDGLKFQGRRIVVGFL